MREKSRGIAPWPGSELGYVHSSSKPRTSERLFKCPAAWPPRPSKCSEGGVVVESAVRAGVWMEPSDDLGWWWCSTPSPRSRSYAAKSKYSPQSKSPAGDGTCGRKPYSTDRGEGMAGEVWALFFFSGRPIWAALAAVSRVSGSPRVVGFLGGWGGCACKLSCRNTAGQMGARLRKVVFPKLVQAVFNCKDPREFSKECN